MTSSAFRPHGTGTRGAGMARDSVLFAGPYGRIFRALPAAEYGRDEAETLARFAELAQAMQSPADLAEGPDPRESGIPAAFTYFGQFVDHDLTFDPASSLQKQNDPQALVDFRTPRFDLDNIYGRGPDDQPYLYRRDGRSFVLGAPMSGGSTGARDLPRAVDVGDLTYNRAIIGDPRNDVNVMVSQLQGLFHRFHNRVVRAHPDWSFARAQRFTRFHYQWIVLNDYLPRIIDARVLKRIAPHVARRSDVVKHPPRLRFFSPRAEAFIPLEFSAAAFRFGHSMVRAGYRLNAEVAPLLIFDGASDSDHALTGFRRHPGNWALDWALFIDLEARPRGHAKPANDAERRDNAARLQFAHQIDTALVDPLANLPDSVTGPTASPAEHSLAFRNLLRGWRMRLPSGQDIARAMGARPLPDDRIRLGSFIAGKRGDLPDITTIAGGAFAGNCPLWAYVLAETRKANVSVTTRDGTEDRPTYRLGDVGGTIVAETFLGLMCADSNSFLVQDPLWHPRPRGGDRFGLREFILYALGDPAIDLD